MQDIVRIMFVEFDAPPANAMPVRNDGYTLNPIGRVLVSSLTSAYQKKFQESDTGALALAFKRSYVLDELTAHDRAHQFPVLVTEYGHIHRLWILAAVFQ